MRLQHRLPTLSENVTGRPSCYKTCLPILKLKMCVVWLKCACIVYNFIFPSVPWSGQIQLSLSFHLYVFYRFVIRESFLHTDVLVLQERTNVSVSINRSPYAHGFKYTQPIGALSLPEMSSEACAFMHEIQACVE